MRVNRGPPSHACEPLQPNLNKLFDANVSRWKQTASLGYHQYAQIGALFAHKYQMKVIMTYNVYK